MNDDKMSLEASDGKHKVKMSFLRSQMEDLRVYHNIDAEAELMKILNEELLKQLRGSFIDYVNKKSKKQVFSELDPYGEEDWDN